jgi:S-adenosylmethionine decarboxylase proenzyme
MYYSIGGIENTSLKPKTSFPTKSHHYLLCMWGVDPLLLNNMKKCLSILKKSSKVAGTKVLSIAKHKFKPQGLTAVLLLSTSHLSIHTWPEHTYCAIDFYSCGDQEKLREGINYLIKHFSPKKFNVDLHTRGVR